MLLRTLAVTGKDGLFGRRFTDPIGLVHLLTGLNDAGKSTRIVAIAAGLRGLATSARDVSRPYIGEDRPQASVTLSFDQGQLTRDLAPSGGKAVDEANGQVAALLGTLPTRWDLEDFARATDAGRQQVLNAVITAGGLIGSWSVKRVVAELTAEVGTSDLERDPLDEVLNACGTPRQPETEDGEERADAASWEASHWDATSPDGWLTEAKAWYGPGKGSAFTTENAAASAAEAAAGIHPADIEPPTGTRWQAEARVTELLAERDEALAALRVVEVAIEAAAQRGRDEARHIEAVQLAVAEVEEAEAAVFHARTADAAAVKAADETHGQRLAIVEAEKKRAEDSLAAFRLLPVPDTSEALGTLEIARAELTGAGQELAAASAALTASVESGGALRTAKDGAAAALAALVALAENLGETGCRHCGGRDPADLTARIDIARAVALEAEQALAVALREHAPIKSADIQARASHRLAEDDVRSAEGALAEAKRVVQDHAARLSALEAEVANTAKAHADFPASSTPTATLPAAQERVVRARAAQVQAEAAITTWQAETSTALPVGDAEHCKSAVAIVDGLLKEAKALVEAHRAHDQREADRQAAIGASARAAARLARVKAIGKAVDGLREQLAQAAFGPIAESVTGFLGACGLDDRFYIDDASTFGLVRRGKRISFYALSDSSRALVGAALAVTFAGQSKSRWPVVMIDRLEAVDPERVGGVLAGLVKLQASGQIAQAICAMRYSGVYDAPAGVTVQRVGGAT